MNRTQKAIIETFWQILEEKPYNKITVQNIVERCQVNRNTFYYHFQDIPALAEYSIKEWSDQIIRSHCGTESPANCITSFAQEFVKRKTAFIHIYRSACGEALLRYLNEVGLYVVQTYIDNTVRYTDIPPEEKSVFVRYYKCTIVGAVLDWLAVGCSYDLLDFCEKVCFYFEGTSQKAFSKLTAGAAKPAAVKKA